MRWLPILWQVRGQSAADELTLIRSALAAPFLSLCNIQDWQDPILLQDANVEVPGFGRFSLRARTDDLWHVLPWREHSIAELARKVLRPGDAFIDAGANIGIYTVLASRLVGPGGRVISIEMMPDTAKRLESHIHMNHLRNVTVVKNAISDVEGDVVIAMVQAGKYGQASISGGAERHETSSEIPVQTTTLDAVAERISSVKLMKIDVEGAELQAFRGAKSLLKKTNFIAYEAWSRGCVSKDALSALLEDAGFALRKLDGNNWLAEKSE
ncbi:MULTISPECIES: FkbM family methyltransferase [Luteimonas]|uniref:FkbM family methyltransferase n=1 Tax=Luteimonas TaxID=83614 RepID=UPI0012FD901E|nr:MULTISPECIES: FkbM family methyltransferase [Luteimonas]